MTTPRWLPFPFRGGDYDRPGPALAEAWSRLHQGDREAFPDEAALTKLIRAHPGLTPSQPIAAAAARLADAWRAYHRGDFAEATEIGLSVGPLGTNVANKATNIYATHLEPDEAAKLEHFRTVAARAEALQAIAPGVANAHYLHAQALGRYSQGISIAKALTQGLAGKVKASLDRTLELEPSHADAHIALGSYHAEIVAKVGGMLAGLTYGANKDDAVKHFQTALRLDPASAVARIEYANGLVMMYGKAKMKEALAFYTEAAKCRPRDAMERLDVELAKQELAD